MMSNPKISIIIPVYNAERYLRQCLDSILAQTYPDWECILVDDGSKDSSGDICDEYTQKDSRFKVYHKENGGVSSARNCGLDNARGEWIGWVDSDDYVEPEFLQNFMELPQDVDMLQQGFHATNWHDGKGNREIYTKCRYCKDRKELLPSIIQILRIGQFPYLWCKLFKKSIIETNELRFNTSISFQEDYLFIVDYLCRITSFANSPKCGICYNFPQIIQKYRKRQHLYVYKTAYSQLASLAEEDTVLDDLQKWYAEKTVMAFTLDYRNISFTDCYSTVKWLHRNFKKEIFTSVLDLKTWSLLRSTYNSNYLLETCSLYFTLHCILKVQKLYKYYKQNF